MALNPITTALLAGECVLTCIIFIVYRTTNTYFGLKEANDYGEGVMFMSIIVSVLLLVSLSAESKTRFNGLYAVIGGLMYCIAGIIILAQWSGNNLQPNEEELAGLGIRSKDQALNVLNSLKSGEIKRGGLGVGSLSLFQGAGMIVRGVFHFKQSA